MVYIVPTEAPSAPTYMYISYLMFIITNLAYIWDNFGLKADGSNKMSHSAELIENRWWILKP